MEITFELFNGFALGIEYVSKDRDLGIDESVVIVEVGFLRMILWTGDVE